MHQQVLSALEEQPKKIAQLTHGLPTRRLHDRTDGDWSINDVLAHLRSCSDVWGKYIAIIVEEDHPTFRAVNPRKWIESTSYRELDYTTSFEQFNKQRKKLVESLRRLPAEGWLRTATVTGGGRPREWTVLDYARRLADHERAHLKQIARLV